MKRYTSFYTLNVLPRWDTFLREFARDVPNMSTNTLLMMSDNPIVHSELVRRGVVSAPVQDEGYTVVDDDHDGVFTVTVAHDDDFVPFGEDGRLPKHLRSYEFKYWPTYTYSDNDDDDNGAYD